MHPLELVGEKVQVWKGGPEVGPDGPSVVSDLCVLRGLDGTLVSYWRPTPEELADLNAGGAIALRIRSGTLPAVSLYAVPVVRNPEGGISVVDDAIDV